MNAPTDGIFVRDGEVIIRNVAFITTPSVIDVGNSKLLLQGCYSQYHGGGDQFTLVAGAGSRIFDNAFGIKEPAQPKRKPWWRFW